MPKREADQRDQPHQRRRAALREALLREVASPPRRPRWRARRAWRSSPTPRRCRARSRELPKREHLQAGELGLDVARVLALGRGDVGDRAQDHAWWRSAARWRAPRCRRRRRPRPMAAATSWCSRLREVAARRLAERAHRDVERLHQRRLGGLVHAVLHRARAASSGPSRAASPASTRASPRGRGSRASAWRACRSSRSVAGERRHQ